MKTQTTLSTGALGLLTAASGPLMSKVAGGVIKAEGLRATHIWRELPRLGHKGQAAKCPVGSSQIKFPVKGQVLPLPALFKVLSKQAGRTALQVRVLTTSLMT